MAWSLFILPPDGTGAALIKSVHGLVLNIKYSCDFKLPKSATYITLSLTKPDSSCLPVKMSERRFLQQLPRSSIIQAIAMIHVPVDEERVQCSLCTFRCTCSSPCCPCAIPSRNMDIIFPVCHSCPLN